MDNNDKTTKYNPNNKLKLKKKSSKLTTLLGSKYSKRNSNFKRTLTLKMHNFIRKQKTFEVIEKPRQLFRNKTLLVNQIISDHNLKPLIEKAKEEKRKNSNIQNNKKHKSFAKLSESKNITKSKEYKTFINSPSIGKKINENKFNTSYLNNKNNKNIEIPNIKVTHLDSDDNKNNSVILSKKNNSDTDSIGLRYRSKTLRAKVDTPLSRKNSQYIRKSKIKNSVRIINNEHKHSLFAKKNELEINNANKLTKKNTIYTSNNNNPILNKTISFTDMVEIGKNMDTIKLKINQHYRTIINDINKDFDNIINNLGSLIDDNKKNSFYRFINEFENNIRNLDQLKLKIFENNINQYSFKSFASFFKKFNAIYLISSNYNEIDRKKESELLNTIKDMVLNKRILAPRHFPSELMRHYENKIIENNVEEEYFGGDYIEWDLNALNMLNKNVVINKIESVAEDDNIIEKSNNTENVIKNNSINSKMKSKTNIGSLNLNKSFNNKGSNNFSNLKNRFSINMQHKESIDKSKDDIPIIKNNDAKSKANSIFKLQRKTNFSSNHFVNDQNKFPKRNNLRRMMGKKGTLLLLKQPFYVKKINDIKFVNDYYNIKCSPVIKFIDENILFYSFSTYFKIFQINNDDNNINDSSKLNFSLLQSIKLENDNYFLNSKKIRIISFCVWSRESDKKKVLAIANKYGVKFDIILLINRKLYFFTMIQRWKILKMICFYILGKYI